ncbi:MAG: Gluconate 2-dehydrogenase subunit 3 [Myxococcales bacterium]|nr:Gluconate 2-dehydrogenase subunit 3 [Myxococcales bacterium]
MTNPLTDNELTILGALAETLIPTDDTPGADAEWAKAFVVNQVRRHADDGPRFRALATHLEITASTEHGKPFVQLSVAEREAVLAAHHPSLSASGELAAEESALRRAMRDIIAGFLSADDFDLRDDPYHMRPGAPRRDRELPSTADYSTADYIPDAVIDRHIATWSGTGTYARVWLAAGYACPPGVAPEDPESVARAPDELVALRKKR